MRGSGIQIIGIDAAVDARKIGLARTIVARTGPALRELHLPSSRENLLALLERWIREHEGPSLLAVDSPLGWPLKLGRLLSGHRAGDPIGEAPDELFRRVTDRVVRARVGKQPLEVGADRIARTAVSTLALLGDLGTRLRRSVELVWDSGRPPALGAIETYPAAWLRLRPGLPASGYKDGSQAAAGRRRQIAECLAAELDGGELLLEVEVSHLIDAAICTLCGLAFLKGECLPPDPEIRAVVAKEGWIWFPDPERSRGAAEKPTAPA